MKCFIFIIVLFSWVNGLYATHLAGGNISVRDLGYNNFEITINISRDTSAGSAPLNQLKYTFYKTDLSFFFTKFISFQLIASGPLDGHPQNVELYQAKDTVNFLTAGDYKVYIRQCCMPGPFNNASINREFYLECAFKVFNSTAENSTPFITNPAINVVPVNQAFTYTINALDIDGDVVRIYSIHPLEAENVPIPFYIPPASDPGNVFHVDSVSGDVTWTPNQIGRFLVSFEIQEIRNRIIIGKSIINQTFIVTADSNHIPIINNFSALPVDAYGYKSVQLIPNQNYTLSLFAHDLDNDSINLLAYGEPFLMQTNSASLLVNSFSANQLQGIFQWTPDSSAVRIKKYQTTFRIQDAHFAQDYTLYIQVGNLFQGVHQFPSFISDVTLYPVPAQHEVKLKFNIKTAQTLNFKILDSRGLLVQALESQTFETGINEVTLPINLNTGLYFIEICNHHQVLKTNALLVVSK